MPGVQMSRVHTHSSTQDSARLMTAILHSPSFSAADFFLLPHDLPHLRDEDESVICNEIICCNSFLLVHHHTLSRRQDKERKKEMELTPGLRRKESLEVADLRKERKK